MKSLNANEEKTDKKIFINYIKRFIVGIIFIVLLYISFVAIINITLPFEVAVTFNILSIIVGLILAVLFKII